MPDLVLLAAGMATWFLVSAEPFGSESLPLRHRLISSYDFHLKRLHLLIMYDGPKHMPNHPENAASVG
jgi:hypothetical protein